MKEETCLIQADTLQEAHKQAESRRPQGLALFLQEILSDGEPATARGHAETIEQAYHVAERKLPSAAVVTDRRVIRPPRERVIEVEAFSEQEAQSLAQHSVDYMVRLDRATLKTTGAKGILSIGRRPSRYEVHAFEKPIVEVAYQAKPQIRVTILLDLPERGHCQACGRPDSPAKPQGRVVHYYCSPNCEERYQQMTLVAPLSLVSIAALPPDAPGLRSVERESVRMEPFCWFCGSRISIMVLTMGGKCHACGNTEIRL
jgi:hypothetical protein